MLWLTEPLEFEFMRNAIAIGILIGILSAVIGSYLIAQVKVSDKVKAIAKKYP